MVGERAAKKSTPKCPECGGAEVDELASDGAYLRYQCRNLKCLHGPCFAAALERDREERRKKRMTEEEVVTMGKTKLLCDKGCGREFVHPKRKTNHEAECDGVQKAARPRAAAKPARFRPEAHSLIVTTSSTPVTPPALPVGPQVLQVPEHMAGTPLGEAVSLLLRRRADLQQELAGIDQAANTIIRQSAAAAIGEAAGRTFRKLEPATAT